MKLFGRSGAGSLRVPETSDVDQLTASYLDGLAIALRDTRAPVRIRAAEALANLRDERAMALLVAALEDTDSEVQRAIVISLNQFERDAVDRQILSRSDESAVIRTLATIGDVRAVMQIIKYVEKMCASGDRFSEAVVNLAKTGDELAYEYLVRRYANLLRSHESKMAAAVHTALLNYGSAEAFRWLMPLHGKGECTEATGIRDLLSAILERDARNASLDDLRKLAALGDIKADDYDRIVSWDSEKDITYYQQVEVSYRHIREIADRELSRRQTMQ
jgi:hypothetical protein